MEFESVIKERKSTRLFSNKKIDKEVLDKILEAGRIAPTAKNCQPFKIYVIDSEDGIKKLDKCTPCRYKAPTVLVVCGDKDKAWVKDGESMLQVDASIVATHMMLEATNLGVDNIWIGMFKTEELKKEFDIPDNLTPVCLLPLGYKAKLCPPSPLHKIRKNIEDLVMYK